MFVLIMNTMTPSPSNHYNLTSRLIIIFVWGMWCNILKFHSESLSLSVYFVVLFWGSRDKIEILSQKNVYRILFPYLNVWLYAYYFAYLSNSLSLLIACLISLPHSHTLQSFYHVISLFLFSGLISFLIIIFI